MNYNKKYQPFEMNILKIKQLLNVSLEDALKNVIPIDWGEDIENNRAKVYATAIEE